jgi:hypothetical protein
MSDNDQPLWAEPGFARREPTPRPAETKSEGGGPRGNHGFPRAETR